MSLAKCLIDIRPDPDDLAEIQKRAANGEAQAIQSMLAEIDADLAEIRTQLGGQGFDVAKPAEPASNTLMQPLDAGPSTLSQVQQSSSLETWFKRVTEKVYQTGRDLKLDIQAAVRAAAGTIDLAAKNPETFGYAVRMGVSDAFYALKSNANAVGWYDRTVSKALKVLALIHPETETDPAARLAFRYALAVTSNGMKVNKNFELAEQAYRGWKETGRMPNNIGAGTAKDAINQSLGLFNDLIDKYGADLTAEFLDLPFTIGQLDRMGFPSSGESQAVVVRGAAILGPKIGNGFYANLNGHFDALTIDRWLMRTWGRWTGTLIEERPDMVKAKSAELTKLIARLKKSPKAYAAFEEATGVRLDAADISQLTVDLRDASTDPEVRKKMNKTVVGSNIRKTANGLFRWLDGQVEMPTPALRPYMRQVFSSVLSELQSQGYPDLTMSDLQALLWYPEKRLYDSAKADEAGAEGYTDDEAPDYANAAILLARKLGKTDAEITATVKNWEENYGPANGRAGSARRNAGNPPPARIEERAAALDRGKQKVRTDLLKRGIFEADRLGRESDGAPRVYRAGGSKDLKGLRGVKAVYKPAAAFANTLKAAELPALTLHELDASEAPAFHAAISASKAASKYGAAVYVYPLEDYAGMRLFATPDMKNGFAVKPDGDIVSVFSAGGGAVHSMLTLAVEEGGTKLDAFDTVLIEIYGLNGFSEVSRDPWNDDYKPADWDYETFKVFNNGKPDIVYMVYRPQEASLDTTLLQEVEPQPSQTPRQPRIYPRPNDPLTQPEGAWRDAQVMAMDEAGNSAPVNAGDAVDFMVTRIQSMWQLLECVNAD